MQHDYQTTPRDPQLWELARRRASFRYHLVTYLIINAFLWALWYFTTGSGDERQGFPWPVFPLLGWGTGLLFHYLGAFVFPRQNQVEEEYNKLLNMRNNQQSSKL